MHCRIQGNLKRIHIALTSIRETLVVDRLCGCGFSVYDWEDQSMYKLSMQKEVEECKVFIVSDLIQTLYAVYVYIFVYALQTVRNTRCTYILHKLRERLLLCEV